MAPSLPPVRDATPSPLPGEDETWVPPHILKKRKAKLANEERERRRAEAATALEAEANAASDEKASRANARMEAAAARGEAEQRKMWEKEKEKAEKLATQVRTLRPAGALRVPWAILTAPTNSSRV